MLFHLLAERFKRPYGMRLQVFLLPGAERAGLLPTPFGTQGIPAIL
jgi:hypothetical protein